MSSFNDVKYKTLLDAGYQTGTINDRMMAYLRGLGATGTHIDDMIFQYLGSLGYNQRSINDRWYAYLEANGYPQSHISDKLFKFWEDGGFSVAPAGYDLTMGVAPSDVSMDGIEYTELGWFTTSIMSETTGLPPTVPPTPGAFQAMPLWTFPAVNLTTCSSAIFTVTVNVAGIAGSTMKIYAEQADSPTSNTKWSATKLPHNIASPYPYQYTITTASSLSTLVDTLGTYNIDLTSVISEVMGGAFWASGNLINLVGYADSAGAAATFGRAGSGVGPPSRLQITP